MRYAVFLMVLLANLAAADIAIAGKSDPEWNPPVRFDHPYNGSLKLYRLPQKEVVRVCQNMPGAWPGQHGCSLLDGNHCTVVVIDKTYMGATPESVLRHEIGHCNGWPADHPN